MNSGWRYLRTFPQLLVTGFGLVALPLALGLIGNALSIRHLSDQSQQVVYQSVRISQSSRALIETVAAEERAARQFLVLGDTVLYQDYVAQHRRLLDITSRLSAYPLDHLQRELLTRIRQQEHEIHTDLSGPDGARMKDGVLASRFSSLGDMASLMLAQGIAATDREVIRLRELATDAERITYYQLAALLPIAALLVAGFSRLLSRPITQIKSSIATLRYGRFERSINVDGPRDLEDLGHQLDRLRLRLVELEEQKSRFLRQISHELKTPLTALYEGASLLDEEIAGPLNPRQKELLRILTDNSRQLRRLIEDLLAYAAAEFEQAAIKRSYFPLDDLVKTVIDKHALSIQARELQIETRIHDVTLHADRERMRCVLDNLLSNAIKHSPMETVISIGAWLEAKEVVIEIADAGPGIPAADHDRIFDPFYQGTTPSRSPLKGSGLGLSIAREHILAHGGRIQLMEGAGARFQIRLLLP
ncbi:MAG: HAMP domain-containing histidine kinase [Proteobacteria bacterium]|nr:HAMP domain-containing histidine kinase [Pseudomonadota bacterium]HQR02640.1 HAMP domain-containing sensor histidine kinase [Rhodocyclaceae bacterium]